MTRRAFAVALPCAIGALGRVCLAGAGALVVGRLTATDSEADEGFFAVGAKGAAILAPPGSLFHDEVKAQVGTDVRVIVEPVPPE